MKLIMFMIVIGQAQTAEKEKKQNKKIFGDKNRPLIETLENGM